MIKSTTLCLDNVRAWDHCGRQRPASSKPKREKPMNVRMLGLALCASFFVLPAFADDTVKIGYIDPLSGGGASIGDLGLKTFQYLADELNAAGGLNGKKIEIVPLDNKTNPQESLIQAQKAADDGVRIITQGNGSSVAAALTDWVSKYNDRNPGKEILYFNYAAVDPVLTNAKCSFWLASCKTPFSGNQNGIGWSTNTNRSANPVLFCKFLVSIEIYRIRESAKV